MKETAKISEDEAQLYDRQIRLWGLDAQKRLRASRVLIVGMAGLGTEVAKNLVLAGIKSLTAMDHENLRPGDFDACFLAPRDKVGTNRAEASLTRLQQLNPGVEITANVTNAAEIVDKDLDDFVKKYDIILVTCQPKAVAIRWNEACRKADDVNFFSGDLFGFFGYSFMDLVEHEYVEEVKMTATMTADDDGEEVDLEKEDGGGEPKAKKAKKTTSETSEVETKMVKQSMKFATLKAALDDVDWSAEVYKKRLRRMDPSFFVMQILLEFQSREGRGPELASKEADLKLLESLAESIAAKFGLPEGKIDAKILPLLFGNLSPVSAVVGGIVAQEVIKVISNKDAPHNNFFFYNPLASAGIVEAIGY